MQSSEIINVNKYIYTGKLFFTELFHFHKTQEIKNEGILFPSQIFAEQQLCVNLF